MFACTVNSSVLTFFFSSPFFSLSEGYSHRTTATALLLGSFLVMDRHHCIMDRDESPLSFAARRFTNWDSLPAGHHPFHFQALAYPAVFL